MAGAELSLWERYGRGDEVARRELLLAYVPLTEVLAKRIARSAGWSNWEDLKQEGFIGLMKAATRFDPSRGVEFRTFAKEYIRGAIFDSSELTRDLARRQQEIYRKVRQAEAELTRILLRNPTIEEVAEKTDLTTEQIRYSIDAIGVAFAGGLPDAEDWSAAHPVETAQAETTILTREALSHLSERESLIIIGYYWEDQSPQEIADRLGLTSSNVTKIRQRALQKLRKLLEVQRKGGHDED